MLDIKRELAAVDSRNYDFYSTLSDQEKKEFAPYVLMRYVGSVQGDAEVQEWFIERTNELVNKNHWNLSKNHKELLWKLFAGCGIGDKLYHPYLAAPSKQKTNKIEKLIAELNPAAKLSDVKLQAGLMTKDDIKKLFDDLGFDKKQQKDYS